MIIAINKTSKKNSKDFLKSFMKIQKFLNFKKILKSVKKVSKKYQKSF